MIFRFSLITLIGFITAFSFYTKSEFGADSDELRVAFPYNKKASHYDPAKIYLAPEYVFLQNIYSSLVQVSMDNGDIIEGVAKEYFWKGNDLHLVIREGLKTADGDQITAKDVEFSLKRLMVLSRNAHGNLSLIHISEPTRPY